MMAQNIMGNGVIINYMVMEYIILMIIKNIEVNGIIV